MLCSVSSKVSLECLVFAHLKFIVSLRVLQFFPIGICQMECQPSLAEIMAKLESLTQTMIKLQAERKTPESEDTPP